MTRIDALNALKDLLWISLSEAEADKRAALANQYRATLAELAELTKDEAKAVDSIDEIAARRTARGGSTARPRRAAADTV